jgi:hypothetical protein
MSDTEAEALPLVEELSERSEGGKKEGADTEAEALPLVDEMSERSEGGKKEGAVKSRRGIKVVRKLLEAAATEPMQKLDCAATKAKGIDAARSLGEAIDTDLVAKVEAKVKEVLGRREAAVARLREVRMVRMADQDLDLLNEAIEEAKRSGVEHKQHRIGTIVGEAASDLYLSQDNEDDPDDEDDDEEEDGEDDEGSKSERESAASHRACEEESESSHGGLLSDGAGSTSLSEVLLPRTGSRKSPRFENDGQVEMTSIGHPVRDTTSTEVSFALSASNAATPLPSGKLRGTVRGTMNTEASYALSDGSDEEEAAPGVRATTNTEFALSDDDEEVVQSPTKKQQAAMRKKPSRWSKKKVAFDRETMPGALLVKSAEEWAKLTAKTRVELTKELRA